MLHAILRVTARAVTDYLNAQIDAGAQAVMIFDSWGGALADSAFQTFSLAYTRQILRELTRHAVDAQGQQIRVPHIVFTKGGGLWLEEIAATGVGADRPALRRTRQSGPNGAVCRAGSNP
jgi:uroporphyrinogen decarboxylase